jgi:anti-anti-sigma regulatory factor
MLKIVAERYGHGTQTLFLEGRLIGPWVEELERACEHALALSPSVTLDLGSVSFVDRDGAALLRALAGRHADLTNCSPFVAAQLVALER